MPTNKFSQNDQSVIAPYTRAVLITPSDTVDLTEIPRALMAHGSANPTTIKVMFVGDTTPVTLYVGTGTWLPFRVSRIYATTTTATTITALY